MQTDCETLSFGIFTLDTRLRTLSSAATQVPLHARAFDILVYLIQHRDRAVSHAEITAHVWSGRVVSDNNLSVQLSNLRKALAEAGEARQLILTLPERHYRFVGELAGPAPDVSVCADDPPLAPLSTSPVGERPRKFAAWRLAAGVAGLAIVSCAALLRFGGPATPAAPRLSFVVLPFRNVSADRTEDYLADGITDYLTADLAHIPASTVIARESAVAVKQKTPQRIGIELGVRYIVSGSVDPEDGRTHVIVSLIEAATGRELWTTQFDPSRDHVSEVRGAIVQRIAATLNVAINELEAGRIKDGGSQNPDSLDLFFRARSILDSGQTLKDFESAHQLLHEATGSQPDFADAHAELGWMLLRKVTTLSDPDQAADLAEAHAEIQIALKSSPNNTKAIAAHAMEQYNRGDCAGAQQNASRALALEPSSLSARTVLAACAQAGLRFDDAIREYEGLLQLNPASPHNPVFYLIIGTLRLVQGNVAEATKYLSLAKDDDAAPTADLEPAEQARLLLIAAHDLGGERAKARNEYEAYAKKFSGRTVWRIASYFDADWQGLDGLRRALNALEDAGMPRYGDESDPGTQGNDACAQGAFARTPRWLPAGGRVLETKDVVRIEAGATRPLVVDLGAGIQTEPDWTLYRNAEPGENQTAFALRIAHEHARDEAAPIVVLGEGVAGCIAYVAAHALIDAGHTDVQWYRGGEEAWAKYKKK